MERLTAAINDSTAVSGVFRSVALLGIYHPVWLGWLRWYDQDLSKTNQQVDIVGVYNIFYFWQKVFSHLVRAWSAAILVVAEHACSCLLYCSGIPQLWLYCGLLY